METEPIPQSEEVIFKRELYTESRLTENYEAIKIRKTVPETFKSIARQVTPKCIGNQILSYIPIINVLRTYQWKEWIVMDAIAGLSAAFIHLPQCLGYGILASLTPVYGLYTTFFPILVYIFLGTSPHMSVGTNAVFALLSAGVGERELKFKMDATSPNSSFLTDKTAQLLYKVDHCTAVTLVAGFILLGMGLFRMGFLTSFMSQSFIGGFTFAAACHIATSQVGKLLALKIPVHVEKGKLVLTWIDIFTGLPQTNPADVIIGIISLAVLLGVKVGINERFKDKLKFPIPIELVVVIVSTLISHYTNLHDKYKILIVGTVPSGFPPATIPPIEFLSAVATDGFIMAILIFVLNIALAKLTAKLHDIEIDDNQELVSYGACQIVGAFFGNFPSSSSPPRTMLLSSSGSKSTLNGVTSCVFIFVVMMWAGVLFVSLPIAMLAAMIIVAMKDLLLQIRNLRPLWRANKSDFWIWVFTAVSGVFVDLDIGLLVGVAFSMVTVISVSQLAKGTLYGKAGQEDIITELRRRNVHPIQGIKIFRFESALYFASMERFKNQIYKRVMDPRLKSKKNAVVKVVMEQSPPDTVRGGCAGRFTPGKKRPKLVIEAENPVGDNNNGVVLSRVNKGFTMADETDVDLGTGHINTVAAVVAQEEKKENGAVITTIPEEPNSTISNPDSHAPTSPVSVAPKGDTVDHTARRRSSAGHTHYTQHGNHDPLHVPHLRRTSQDAGYGRRSSQDAVFIRRSSQDANAKDDSMDIEALPENHYLPRKSLNGEIIFDQISNMKVAEPDPEAADLHFLILDFSCMVYIDVSGTDMLNTIVNQFSRAGVEVLFAAVPRKTMGTLRRANVVGPSAKIAEDKVFFSVQDAVHWAKRTQERRIVVKF